MPFLETLSKKANKEILGIDKNNTTLNLINGAYLETPKTEKVRNDSIKKLLSRQGLNDDEKSNKDNESVEKEEKLLLQA